MVHAVVPLRGPSTASASTSGRFFPKSPPSLLIAKQHHIELWLLTGEGEWSCTSESEFFFRVDYLINIPGLFGEFDGILAASCDGEFMIVTTDSRTFNCVHRDTLPTLEGALKDLTGVVGCVTRVGQSWRVLISAWTGVISVINLTVNVAQEPSTTTSGSATSLSVATTALAFPFAPRGGQTSILSMVWLDNTPGLVAFLFRHLVPDILVGCHLATGLIQLDVNGQSGMSATMSPGPWTLSNVQPTSHSMISLGGGVLVASENDVFLVRDAGVVSHITVNVATCAAIALSETACLLTGLETGLLSVHLDGSELKATKIDIKVSPARNLCFVRPDNTQPKGALFLGSHFGPSQLLDVDASVQPAAVRFIDDGFIAHPGPLVTAASGRIAGAPSLVTCSASIMSQRRSTDQPQTATGDTEMVGGNIRVSLYGAGFLIEANGPSLPGKPSIFSLKANPQDPYDSYLLFSFSASNSSQLMSVRSEEFEATQLSGIDDNRRTLFACTLQTPHILQITDAQVRIVGGMGGLTSSWEPDQKVLDVGVCLGSEVLCGRGSTLYALSADARTISQRNRIILPSEVSAVALGPGNIAAAATWVSQELHLLSYPSLTTTAVVSLGKSHGRSIVFVTGVDQRVWVVVGTGDGLVLLLRLDSKGGVDLRKSCVVGEAAVDLRLITVEDKVAVFVCSTAHAVLIFDQPIPRVSPLQLPSQSVPASLNVEAIRDAFAWIDEEENLAFGFLDLERKLRYRERPVAMTPVKVAFHQPTQRHIVLGEFGEHVAVSCYSGVSLEEEGAVLLQKNATATALTLVETVDEPFCCAIAALFDNETAKGALYCIPLSQPFPSSVLPPLVLTTAPLAIAALTQGRFVVSAGGVGISLAVQENLVYVGTYLHTVSLYEYTPTNSVLKQVSSIAWSGTGPSMCILPSGGIAMADTSRSLSIIRADGDSHALASAECCRVPEIISTIVRGSMDYRLLGEDEQHPVDDLIWVSAGGAVGVVREVPSFLNRQIDLVMQQTAGMRLPKGESGPSHKQWWSVSRNDDDPGNFIEIFDGNLLTLTKSTPLAETGELRACLYP